MTRSASIPAERLQMPERFSVCDPVRFLQVHGLPPRLEWRYPPRSRFACQYVVDFGLLKVPRGMRDVLANAGAPQWYVHGQHWSDYLAIGTWTTLLHTDVSMTCLICVDVKTGAVLRVEDNPIEIENALKGQEDLAWTAEAGSQQPQLTSLAKSELVIFINSSPQQMLACFEEYFSFVNDTSVTAESFLQSVARIDQRAGYSGSMWYLLVADYLNRNEY